jgi:hypothetical protein
MRNTLQEINCIIFVNVLNQVFEGSVLLQESKPGPVIGLLIHIQVLTLNSLNVLIALGSCLGLNINQLLNEGPVPNGSTLWSGPQGRAIGDSLPQPRMKPLITISGPLLVSDHIFHLIPHLDVESGLAPACHSSFSNIIGLKVVQVVVDRHLNVVNLVSLIDVACVNLGQNLAQLGVNQRPVVLRDRARGNIDKSCTALTNSAKTCWWH